MNPTRIPEVCKLTVLVAMFLTTTGGITAGGEKHDKQFESRQRNAMRALERSLTIRPAANVEEVWYVLALSDHSVTSEFSSYRSSGYYEKPDGHWTIEIKREATYRLVKGRKAAADAVYEFMSKASASANNLDPAVADDVSRLQKDWAFRAFRSVREAEACYLYHKGPSDK